MYEANLIEIEDDLRSGDDKEKTKREWALYLASKGFKILRCYGNTKVPANGYSWKKQMTSNAARINEWFDAYPDMNYGVCPAGVGVIIDLDIKEDRNGAEFVKQLEAEYPEDDRILDHTFTVETPSSGRHLYLLIDEEVGNANGFDKEKTAIDVRGWGGYVIGPGCTIHSDNEIGEAYDHHGVYEVINDSSILPCPDWLNNNYLKKPGTRDKNAAVPLMDWDLAVNIAKAVAYLQNHPPAIQGQNGDSHTYELAAQLRDFGISEEKCIELILSSDWNDRCNPPWPFDELETVVENAYRYSENRPGVKADFLGMALEDGTLEAANDNPQTKQVELEKQDAPSRWNRLIHRGENIHDIKPPETIIPGWLPAGGVTALLAKRGVGKTVCAIDVALRLATGKRWCGEPVRSGLHVVYLCGEDHENTAGHIKAWCQKYNDGVIPERFVFVSDVPNAFSDDDIEALLKEIRSDLPEGARVVTVVDTWQRSTAAAKNGQNADQDMQSAFNSLEAVGRFFEGPVLVCFHPPKYDGSTILGSSVIENMTAAILELTEDEAGKLLTVTRIKGRGLGNFKYFRFDELGLGRRDEHGFELTGAIAVNTGGTRSGSLHDKPDDEKAPREREAVYEVVAGFLREGRHVLNHNNARSDAVQPSQIKQAVADRYEIRLTPKQMKEHLHTLENLGRLSYRESGNDKRTKATYMLPETVADECGRLEAEIGD